MAAEPRRLTFLTVDPQTSDTPPLSPILFSVCARVALHPLALADQAGEAQTKPGDLRLSSVKRPLPRSKHVLKH